MSDTKRTEPAPTPWKVKLSKDGLYAEIEDVAVDEHGCCWPMKAADALLAVKAVNAYPANREAIRVMREAAEDLLLDGNMPGNAKLERMKAALKLASALRVGE